MIRIVIVATVSLLSLICIIVPTLAQSKPDPTCERCKAIQKWKDVVKANDGNIDPVHSKHGLIVVITAKTPAGVKAIQDAGDQYQTEAKSFNKSSQDKHCEKLATSLGSNAVTQEIEHTEAGVLVIYTSSDHSAIMLMHDDCCKWCICPGGFRCKPCC